MQDTQPRDSRGDKPNGGPAAATQRAPQRRQATTPAQDSTNSMPRSRSSRACLAQTLTTRTIGWPGFPALVDLMCKVMTARADLWWSRSQFLCDMSWTLLGRAVESKHAMTNVATDSNGSSGIDHGGPNDSVGGRHLPARLPAAGGGDLAERRVRIPAARLRVAAPMGSRRGRVVGGRSLGGPATGGYVAGSSDARKDSRANDLRLPGNAVYYTPANLRSNGREEPRW